MRTRGKGRPRRYRNARQLKEKMDEYFALCDQKHRPYTLSGLAHFLGFANTRSLKRYGADCKAAAHFRHTVGWAWLVVEDQKHQRLLETDGAAARGLIFDLRVNHGWKASQSGRKEEQKAGGAKVRQVGWDEWKKLWEAEETRKAEMRQAKRGLEEPGV